MPGNKRASAGQPFDNSAETYNRTQRAVDYVNTLQNQQPQNNLPIRNDAPVLAYNGIDAVLSVGDIVGLKAPRDDIADSMLAKSAWFMQPKIEVEALTQSHVDAGYWGVVQESTIKTGITPIAVFGETAVNILINDQAHRYAYPVDGNDKTLETGESGPIRLTLPITKNVGEEELTQGVFIRPQEMLVGKADAQIVPGGSGTVSVWRNGSDTGFNIENVQYDWIIGTVYDETLMADVPRNIDAGEEMIVGYFDNELLWRVTNLSQRAGQNTDGTNIQHVRLSEDVGAATFNDATPPGVLTPQASGTAVAIWAVDEATGRLTPSGVSAIVYNSSDRRIRAGFRKVALIGMRYFLLAGPRENKAFTVIPDGTAIGVASVTPGGVITPTQSDTDLPINRVNPNNDAAQQQGGEESIIWNYNQFRVGPGVQEIEYTEDRWVFTGQSMPEKFYADLGEDVLEEPQHSSHNDVVGASSIAGKKVYWQVPQETGPPGALIEVESGQTIYNYVAGMTWTRWVEVKKVGSQWSVCGARQRGNIICKIKDATRVNVNRMGELCEVTDMMGPDKLAAELNANNELMVYNPRDIVGFEELVCGWNQEEARYEVLSSSYGRDGAIIVELEKISEISAGTQDQRRDVTYRAKALQDPMRVFGDFQTSDPQEPYSQKYPNLGQLEDATRGILFYDVSGSAGFRLYDAREKLCVKVAETIDIQEP